MEGIPKGNIDLIWRPRDIYDDFLLNDIKTKQDSMRQLFAVNALLTGAYITVLSGIAIKLFDGSLSKLNLGDGYWGGISGLIVILLLSAPVFSWFYSSARCWGFGTGVESDLVINLKDKAGVSVVTEAEYKSIKYNSGLIQYNRELHLTLSFASLLTNVGLFCVVVYCILAITLFVANLAN